MPKVLVTQPSVTGPDDPRLEALHAAGWEITYEPTGARATPEQQETAAEPEGPSDSSNGSTEPPTGPSTTGDGTPK